MRKLLFLSLALASVGFAYADDHVEIIDGVPVISNFYAHKMTLDGTKIVGETEDGSTVYYNIPDEQFYYYPDCTFGRGYVIADNGWVVGCRLLDSDTQSNEGVIMIDGNITSPEVFKNYVTSNIHSITPDATRICGVVGNSGKGLSNLPYYCDIDENGNLGELKFLPVPEKDFFGNLPQYCTATWISEDGHTIAGQVIENHGFFVYPILYRENEEGIWSYSFPSESLFNMDKLPIPEPLQDFEEEYPDLKSTEITDYISPDKLAAWNEAYNLWETNNFADELDPYNKLEEYMTDAQISEYINAINTYNKVVDEYNEKFNEYWEQTFKIVDTSVFFVRNGMSLSPNGNWLSSSAEWEDLGSDYFDYPEMYYVPYQFNLVTGETKQIGENTANVITYQTFDNGDVINISPTSLALPPRSWLYQHAKDQTISFAEYVNEVSPTYGAWYEEHLSGNIPVGEDDKGYLIYEYAVVTGNVAANRDMTVIAAGVEGTALDYDTLLTYIFEGLPAGVESIGVDPDFNGVYNVYNLQGVKVMTTKEASDINSLPRGLYIINGKKHILK